MRTLLLTLISHATRLAGLFLKWLNDRTLFNAGRARQSVDALETQHDRVKKARAARRAAAARRVSDHDPHRRD